MSRRELSILATVLSLLLASFAQSAASPESSTTARRSSADQRIAELQALLALSSSSRDRSAVAHGMFDPSKIGKKRSPQDQLTPTVGRYSPLTAMVARAHIVNTAA